MAEISPNEPNQQLIKEFAIPVMEVEQIISGIKPRAGNINLPETHFSADYDQYIDTFFSAVINENKDTRDAFSEYAKQFKGQIVVDLGAGITNRGYTLAGFTDAKAYVGVEPSIRNFERLKGILTYQTGGFKLREELGKPLIPAAVVQQDMLSFLRRLPYRSVSILTSGIDGFIIRDGKYIDETNLEIERVLYPGGTYINNDSVFRLNPAIFESIHPTTRGFASFRLTKFTKRSTA